MNTFPLNINSLPLRSTEYWVSEVQTDLIQHGIFYIPMFLIGNNIT